MSSILADTTERPEGGGASPLKMAALRYERVRRRAERARAAWLGAAARGYSARALRALRLELNEATAAEEAARCAWHGEMQARTARRYAAAAKRAHVHGLSGQPA